MTIGTPASTGRGGSADTRYAAARETDLHEAIMAPVVGPSSLWKEDGHVNDCSRRLFKPLDKADSDRVFHLQPRLRRPRQLQLWRRGRHGARFEHRRFRQRAARRAVLSWLFLL